MLSFYYILSAFFFLFQACIVLTTKINIFPELVFFPWLMSKGLLMYRDFNVQHGYFLQLLLLPFVVDKSLFLMKSFYVAIQMTNLLLVLKILRKTTNKLGFIIGGGIFVVLNYYLTDSNLWDEMIVTSIYLFIYYLFIRNRSQNKKKLLLIGILIGAASFMKPSFVIMIIPIVLFTANLIPVVSIIAIWISTVLFFAVNNSLNAFLNGYIFYNIFYALGSRFTFEPQRMFSIQNLTTEKIFTNCTAFLLVASILLFFIHRKTFKNNPIPLFVLFSLALVFPGYSKINLVPFGAFLSIFIAQLLGSVKKQYLFLCVCGLVFYGIFVSRKAKHLYTYFKTNRLPYMENSKTARIVSKIKSFNVGGSKIYVFGNQMEIYYYLDIVPPVYHTVLWQNIIYYYSGIQQRTIKEIKNNNVNLIIIQKPMDINYSNFNSLKKYIKESYTPVYEDADFQMLKKIR